MSMYDHEKVITRQFGGNRAAYKRWMQLRIIESRAILDSALAVISAKAVAISDAARVTSAMKISLQREEKVLDKSLECILQITEFEPADAEAHNAHLQTERDKYT